MLNKLKIGTLIVLLGATSWPTVASYTGIDEGVVAVNAAIVNILVTREAEAAKAQQAHNDAAHDEYTARSHYEAVRAQLRRDILNPKMDNAQYLGMAYIAAGQDIRGIGVGTHCSLTLRGYLSEAAAAYEQLGEALVSVGHGSILAQNKLVLVWSHDARITGYQP